MKTIQKEFNLKQKARGFHLVTSETLNNLPEISDFQVGTLNLFIKHTSASLTINENCDPTVRSDMENFVSDVISNNTYQGEDDMPAHLKSSIFGSSVTIPITDGILNMGTW